jgi:hypothetical protein
MSVGGVNKTAFHQMLPALWNNSIAPFVSAPREMKQALWPKISRAALGTAELKLQKKGGVHRLARLPNLVWLLDTSDSHFTSDTRLTSYLQVNCLLISWADDE